MKPAQVEIIEPSLLIRISKLWNNGLSSLALYEATRGVWVLGERRERVEYAFAIGEGMVQEVYLVLNWYPAGSGTYETRDASQFACSNRWEFTGTVAPEAIRAKYLGKSVSHYFKKGNSNPVNYVGC